jgi:hypothetical protein
VNNGWRRGAFARLIAIGGSLVFLLMQLVAYTVDQQTWRLWAAAGFAILGVLGAAQVGVSSSRQDNKNQT